MEVLVVIGLLVLLGWTSGRPRYRHWRGPTTGSQGEVQREHLDLFFPPRPDGEDGDGG